MENSPASRQYGAPAFALVLLVLLSAALFSWAVTRPGLRETRESPAPTRQASLPVASHGAQSKTPSEH